MKVTKPTNFIALFDIHIGQERLKTKGKEIVRNTHAANAINAVVKFAKDFKPQAIVLGGDQLNAHSISHWTKGKPRIDSGFNLKWEMDVLDKLILAPFDDIIPKDGIKVWHEGNHEAWLQHHIDENPGLEGLIEPRHYLDLAARGYKIYEQGETSNIGKIHFVHGDTVFRNGRGANPASKLVNMYKRNIRAGHIHTYSAAVETTPVDVQDYHSGIVVPCLANVGQAYTNFAPSNAMQGFLCGTVLPNGDFSDQVIIINKGRFVYNGRLYDGNKK